MPECASRCLLLRQEAIQDLVRRHWRHYSVPLCQFLFTLSGVSPRSCRVGWKDDCGEDKRNDRAPVLEEPGGPRLGLLLYFAIHCGSVLGRLLVSFGVVALHVLVELYKFTMTLEEFVVGYGWGCSPIALFGRGRGDISTKSGRCRCSPFSCEGAPFEGGRRAHSRKHRRHRGRHCG